MPHIDDRDIQRIVNRLHEQARFCEALAKAIAKADASVPRPHSPAVADLMAMAKSLTNDAVFLGSKQGSEVPCSDNLKNSQPIASP